MARASYSRLPFNLLSLLLFNLCNLRNLWIMSRGRAARLIEVTPTDVAIPDKLYYRIGEVSELTRTKAFVLRYWETEFSSLRPVKGKSGHRLYRRKDVDLIFQIRRLLYQKGFTIEGGRGPGGFPRCGGLTDARVLEMGGGTSSSGRIAFKSCPVEYLMKLEARRITCVWELPRTMEGSV